MGGPESGAEEKEKALAAIRENQEKLLALYDELTERLREEENQDK